METKNYLVTISSRLDTFLALHMQQTRSQIVQLIKNHGIEIDNIIVKKPGLKVKVGQVIKVTIPDIRVIQPQIIDFDIEILFEDEDILIINKPSGIVTHPAPSVKEATLVDWLKYKNIRLSTISGEERHGIVHRLDKGTSGIMVIAKNNEAHEALSLQLQDKTMGRYYLAIATPLLKDYITTVEAPIKRSSHNRLKMSCNIHGKSAKTQFKKTITSNNEKYEILTCKLFTGRTHQIRVHLEKMNRHILGDHLYGVKNNKNEPERILLHAYMLYFVHPKKKTKEFFIAPIETKMDNFIKQNFNREILDEKIKYNNIELGFSTAN